MTKERQGKKEGRAVHKITKMPCSDTLTDYFPFLTVQSKNFTHGKIDTNVIVHVQP